METDEQLKQNPNAVWPWPEIDPFGLAFGTESRLQKRDSSLTTVRDQLLRFDFSTSKVLENRNIVGTWYSKLRGSVLTIEFGRQYANLPVAVRWQKRNDKTGAIVRLLGFTQTEWMPYDGGFVPKKTSITTERETGKVVDIQLDWEWVPVKTWQSKPVDFNTLCDEKIRNFRKPFIDVFKQ